MRTWKDAWARQQLRATLHTISDKSKVKNNLASQTKDLVLKFVSMDNSSKPWNHTEASSEFEEMRGRRNDAMLMKDGRFGRQCKASLKCIDLIGSSKASLKCIDLIGSHTDYFRHDRKCQKKVSKLLRSLLPCPVVHFNWTIEMLVGYHLMEPFLGIMLD